MEENEEASWAVVVNPGFLGNVECFACFHVVGVTNRIIFNI